jgi:FMN phosphatase YigB (HAD superfamily)
MCEEGLVLAQKEEALAQIKQLDQTKLTSRDTLIEFLEIHQADEKFLEIGMKALTENPLIQMPLKQVEGAMEILRHLKEKHILGLVTMGCPGVQFAKLEKAGIDLTLFSRIAVSEDRNKKIYYEKFARELGFSPSEVIVCGDRIHIDLVPAKELGFKTVHLKNGRGLNSVEPKSAVDFTIFQLNEMKGVIKHVNSEH